MSHPRMARSSEGWGTAAGSTRTRRGASQTAPQLPAHRLVKPMDYQELWDIDDLAKYPGVPKQTIYSWRTTGYGRKGMRIGQHLRWRAATVIT